MSALDDVLAALVKYPELGAWGTPADFSVMCRQDQPPASGSSQYKIEDVPIAQNSYLGRLTGDIVDRTFAEVLSDIGAAAASHTHTEGDITDLDHTDTDAIHDNVGSEISAITEKASPVDADMLLIEDSAASNAKKFIQIGNLPGGGGGDTHPVVDTTELVKGSGDNSKKMRIEVDGITTSTTRTLIMADEDIDLTPGTGSFATEAEGGLAASALQNIVEDASPQLGGDLDLNSLSRVFNDSNGNAVARFDGETSAVNFVALQNAIATVGPGVVAAGSDTNIHLLLGGKGTGLVKAGGVEVVTLSATQTLTAKTLTTPTIASFANAAHNHQDAAGGATLDAAAIAAGTFPTARIADEAITYAKIQDVSATDRLLGRVTAGAGVVEEITLTAAGRALIDDANAAAQRTTLGLGSIATATETDYLLAAGTRPLTADWDAGAFKITADHLAAVKAGTAKAVTNFLTLENEQNAADMDGTGTALLFRQHTSASVAVDSARIAALAETDWTATASTQDSKMVLATTKDGVLTDYMQLSSTGRLLVGNTFTGIGATWKFVAVSENSSGTFGNFVFSDTATNKATLAFGHARGSAATPTISVDGDQIGAVIAGGFDGSVFRYPGRIQCDIDGTVSAGVVPVNLTLRTGTTGTGTARLRIDSDGTIHVVTGDLTLAATGAKLILNNSVNYAIFVNGTEMQYDGSSGHRFDVGGTERLTLTTTKLSFDVGGSASGSINWGTSNLLEIFAGNTKVIQLRATGPEIECKGYIAIKDGLTAPGAGAGRARIYVDSADGDLKVVFADGTVKTIVTDT